MTLDAVSNVDNMGVEFGGELSVIIRFGVCGLGFGVWGFVFRLCFYSGAWILFCSFGVKAFWVLSFGYWVFGFGFRVLGFGFWV